MPHMLPSIGMSISALKDDRNTSPLPPIGHDISRPPSASTVSERRGSPHSQENGGEKVTLPALSTLANVASQGSLSQGQNTSSAPQQAPAYSNASLTPTSVAGQGNVPPICQNCQTSTTPLWRRDEAGSVLCNACGLFLKLHGRPRPISLKTDVIKSRNRVKSSAQNGRRKMQFNPHQPMPHHPDMATPPPHPSYRRLSGQHMGTYSDRSNSPVSRAGTPSSLHPHHTYPGHPHTAPPLTHHLFDPHIARSPSPMPLSATYHTSQSAPGTIAHRGTSPHPHAPTLPLPIPSINGHGPSPNIPPTHPPGPSYAELQTRVSELEVINSLYKSQLQELEDAKRRDAAYIDQLQRQLDDFRAREAAAKAEQQRLRDPPAYLPPPPPEPPSEPVNYAAVTGSMKRRRGRTLERTAEEHYGSKRRETGEFPQPEPVATRG